LKDIDFDTLFTVQPISPNVIPKPHKNDIVVADNSFYVDVGRSPESQDAAMKLFIEDQEFTTPHYKENFFGADGKPLTHYNFVGHIQFPFYPSGEPVIISAIAKDTQILGLCTFHLVVWCWEASTDTFGAQVERGQVILRSGWTTCLEKQLKVAKCLNYY